MNQIAEITVSYSCPIPKNQRTPIRTSKEAYHILLKHWNKQTIELQEEFKMLMLNRANEVLGIYNLSKGGTASTTVDSKLVFAVALKCNAHSIILSHNHPSENLEPSRADIDITKQIKEGCKLLGIKLFDHLVIAKNDYYSFADDGILY